MAHVVERTSADIADRVVIRALAKLQLQQNERESLSQENCIQTDGYVDGIRKVINPKSQAISEAREEGAKKIRRIYDVDKRGGKPDRYSLYYVFWWVREEVDNKINLIHKAHKALRPIMDRGVVDQNEEDELSQVYTAHQEGQRKRRAERDRIYGLWLFSDGLYKERFGSTSTLGSKIKNHLNLSDLEDPDRQFSLGSRIELARKKLEKIQNTNDFKKKAMEEWNEAFSNIELLQQYIVQQWKLWYKMLQLVEETSNGGTNPLRRKSLAIQAEEIKTLLNNYLVDHDVEEYEFEKEVTMDSSDEPQTSVVILYCYILINYIPLCYAMGYLNMKQNEVTNPEGRFCVLYSTEEIKNEHIKKLAEHLQDAQSYPSISKMLG